MGVRVRPLGDAERKRGEEGAWEVDCETNTLRPLVSVEKSNASYTLDQVFDGESDTVSVYKALAAPVVQDVLEGYNGTVFAYGQTSSGKTHTLLGTLEQPGIILQSMQELLMTMATRSTWNDYMMSVSYVEVYNETLVDLLATKQEVTRGVGREWGRAVPRNARPTVRARAVPLGEPRARHHGGMLSPRATCRGCLFCVGPCGSCRSLAGRWPVAGRPMRPRACACACSPK